MAAFDLVSGGDIDVAHGTDADVGGAAAHSFPRVVAATEDHVVTVDDPGVAVGVNGESDAEDFIDFFPPIVDILEETVPSFRFSSSKDPN